MGREGVRIGYRASCIEDIPCGSQPSVTGTKYLINLIKQRSILAHSLRDLSRRSLGPVVLAWHVPCGYETGYKMGGLWRHREGDRSLVLVSG